MKNLSVGIFHDDTLGRELGKKGTESDIAMCNRKTDDHIFTFLSPVADKLVAKTQIISSIDTAILSVQTLTADIGETILLLDACGISTGCILVPPYSDVTPIQKLTKGTCLETYKIIERNPTKIIEFLQTVTPQRDTSVPPLVTIDHSFSVKGVGEVLLGFVKKGLVQKHQTLQLLPLDKEVVVRSIQMQDADVDESPAGSRVGIAIKGATAEEMKRGSILTPQGNATTGTTIPLHFTKNRFYQEEVKDGLFHVTVGMQTSPITITSINNGFLTITSEKPVAYTKDDTFLLLNLNAKKLHFIGHGKGVK